MCEVFRMLWHVHWGLLLLIEMINTLMEEKNLYFGKSFFFLRFRWGDQYNSGVWSPTTKLLSAVFYLNVMSEKEINYNHICILVKETRYNLLISDLEMPVDGFCYPCWAGCSLFFTVQTWEVCQQESKRAFPPQNMEWFLYSLFFFSSFLVLYSKPTDKLYIRALCFYRTCVTDV